MICNYYIIWFFSCSLGNCWLGNIVFSICSADNDRNFCPCLKVTNVYRSPEKITSLLILSTTQICQVPFFSRLSFFINVEITGTIVEILRIWLIKNSIQTLILIPKEVHLQIKMQKKDLRKYWNISKAKTSTERLDRQQMEHRHSLIIKQILTIRLRTLQMVCWQKNWRRQGQ